MVSAAWTLALLACTQLAGDASCTNAPHPDYPTPCPFEFSIRLPDSAQLTENGSVWDPLVQVSYPNGTYWETVWDPERGVAADEYWGCPCEVGIPCLRRCCPAEEAKKWGTQCVSDDVFCPKSLDDGSSLSLLLREKGSMALFGGSHPKGFYSAFPDGGLFGKGCVRKADVTGGSPPECDTVSLGDLVGGEEKYCVMAVGEYEDHPWSCQNSYSLWFGARRYILTYPYGRTVACLSFAAAFLVYACIPELRNLHGKMLLSHLFALLTADLISLVAIVYSLRVGLDWCLFFGFGIQFFFLSSFFWLNIICYDIYTTFRSVGPLKMMRPAKEAKKMVLYSLYAWGMSLLILTVSVTLELMPGLPSNIIKPDFRINICWFYTDLAGGLYFLGFSSLLLGSNVILFTLTAIKIYRLRKETVILENRESVMEMETVKKNKQRFDMYVKLLLMMGFLRTVEMGFRLLLHTNKLLRLSDYTEGVNGFLTFIIFVWKDDIISHIKRKLCRCIRPDIDARVTLRRR